MPQAVTLCNASNQTIFVNNGAAAPEAATLRGLYDGANLRNIRGRADGVSLRARGRNRLSQTFSGSFTSMANLTLATDIAQVQGANGYRIKILEVRLSAALSTARMRSCGIYKRTAANTGASLTPTPQPSYNLASSPPVAQGIFRYYMVAPSALGAGTLVRAEKVCACLVATQIVGGVAVFDFTRNSQPLYLEGSSEFCSVNWIAGDTLPTYNVSFEWSEEAI